MKYSPKLRMLAIASLAFFLGCDNKKASILEDNLLGTWERQEYNAVLTFNEDGTFEEEFIVLRSPELGSILVKGIWSLANSSLKYTITYSSDEQILPDKITFVDEVVSITNGEFTYLPASGKERVTLYRKVN